MFSLRLRRWLVKLLPAAPLASFPLAFLALLLGTAVFTAAAAPAPGAAASTRDWRRPAVERQRRILFNNDGNDPITCIRRPSVDDMLAARTGPLADTHVDALFYCTFSAGFGNFSHFTKVGQVHTTTEGQFVHNQMAAFLRDGVDPLRVMIDFAHRNRMECFWSMRMNDTHDGGKSGQGPILFRNNALKVAHPEFLLGSPDRPLKCGAWSAVNYARPEIRELAFRYVEEVCTRYDVDGVELDFFRHPVFFPSTGRGEPATAEELGQMTGLMRRIRAMADAAGRSRGRPLLVAMRVPDSAGYARAIGLDLESWLADDLLDLMIVGSYLQLNDWGTSVALGHRHGVKVYPSLDESRIREELADRQRMTGLAYRGRAANVWASGADGVYLFNQFDPKLALWKELGDPAALASLDKDYFASLLGVGAVAGRALPHRDWQTVETLCPSAPRTLTPGGTTETARLVISEALGGARPPLLRLRLRFDRTPEGGHPVVVLNGKTLAEPESEGTWLSFRPAAGLFRTGVNTVAVALPSRAKGSLRWLDLLLEVRHAP